jgi:hypothetical protein
MTLEVSVQSLLSKPMLTFSIVGLGLLAGCTASTAQIVKAPFISPMVIPSANKANAGEFTLIAAVRNYGTTTSPDLWLGVSSEYWPNCSAAWCAAWPQVIPPVIFRGLPTRIAIASTLARLRPTRGGL